MKVSELIGDDLDYWVAVAERYVMERPQDMQMMKGKYRILVGRQGFNQKQYEYSPSSNWAQGGPIIHREMIELSHDREWTESGEFGRVWQGNHAGYGYCDGDTLLIAAMRAYVASKFGETVPDQVPA